MFLLHFCTLVAGCFLTLNFHESILSIQFSLILPAMLWCFLTLRFVIFFHSHLNLSFTYQYLDKTQPQLLSVFLISNRREAKLSIVCLSSRFLFVTFSNTIVLVVQDYSLFPYFLVSKNKFLIIWVWMVSSHKVISFCYLIAAFSSMHVNGLLYIWSSSFIPFLRGGL